MKSSYTKRALAFWLAVAMVATSAPMAFAAGSTTPMVTSEPAPAATITNLQLSESTVEVNGQVDKQVTATVTLSADATVTWSATDGVTVIEDAVASTEGSITKTATIKVPAKAVAGQYTITANVCSSSKSVQLSVTRTGEKVATGVTVSGGATELTIPATSIPAETTFTAEAKSAFDDSLPVTWSVATTQPNKVSIDTTGKLTVKQ